MNNSLPDINDRQYQWLRAIAQKLLRREAFCTLTATELVHELILKAGRAHARFLDNRGHTDHDLPGTVAGHASESFVFAGRALRQLLVDRARRRLARARQEQNYARHGHSVDRPSSKEAEQAARWGELEESLESLARQLPQHAELVRLRLQGGLSVEEAANVLGLSRAAAYRHWTFCKAWLSARMSSASRP